MDYETYNVYSELNEKLDTLIKQNEQRTAAEKAAELKQKVAAEREGTEATTQPESGVCAAVRAKINKYKGVK